MDLAEEAATALLRVIAKRRTLNNNILNCLYFTGTTKSGVTKIALLAS